MIRCLNLILATAVIFSSALFTQTTFGQSAGNHARIKLPETSSSSAPSKVGEMSQAQGSTISGTVSSRARLIENPGSSRQAKPHQASGQRSVARIRHLNEPQVPAVATPEPTARRLQQPQMSDGQPMSEADRLALVTYLQQRSVLERTAQQQPAARVAQQLPDRVPNQRDNRPVAMATAQTGYQTGYSSQQTNFQQPTTEGVSQQPAFESAPPFAGHPNGIANSRNNVVTQNRILRMNPSDPSPLQQNQSMEGRAPQGNWSARNSGTDGRFTRNDDTTLSTNAPNQVPQYQTPRMQPPQHVGEYNMAGEQPRATAPSGAGFAVSNGGSRNRVATNTQSDHAVPLRATPPRWKQFESQMRQPSQSRSRRYGRSPLNAAPPQNPFAHAKFRQDDPFGERPTEENKQADDPFGEPASDPFEDPDQDDPFGDPPQQQTPPTQEPTQQGDDPFGQRPAQNPQEQEDPFGQRNEPSNDGLSNPVLPGNSVPPQLPGDATNGVITPEMQVRPVPDPVNPRSNDVRQPQNNTPPANTGNQQRPNTNRRDPNIGRDRRSVRVPQRPAHEMREPTYSPYQTPPLLTPRPERAQANDSTAPGYQPNAEIPYYGADGMPIQPNQQPPYYGQPNQPYGQPMPAQGAPMAYGSQPQFGQPGDIYQSVADGAIVGCDDGCGVAAIDPCVYQPQFYLSLFAGQAELDTLSGMDAIGQNLIGFEFDGSNTVGGIALGQLQGYNLRSELEFSYRTFDVDSLSVSGGLPSINANLDGSLDTYSGMVNAYWEFMSFPNEKIKPYAGFGVGFMILDPGFTNTSGQLTKLDYDDSTFAYQYMAGLNYKLHANTDLFFEWRVMQADRIRIDTDLSGFGSSSDGSGKFDFRSSNVLFGARFKF